MVSGFFQNAKKKKIYSSFLENKRGRETGGAKETLFSLPTRRAGRMRPPPPRSLEMQSSTPKTSTSISMNKGHVQHKCTRKVKHKLGFQYLMMKAPILGDPSPPFNLVRPPLKDCVHGDVNILDYSPRLHLATLQLHYSVKNWCSSPLRLDLVVVFGTTHTGQASRWIVHLLNSPGFNPHKIDRV